MIELTQRSDHFERNVLTWMALCHFLPAEFMREYLYVLVDVVTGGSVSLSDLFEEKVFEGDSLTSWVVRPKHAETPLTRYLQHRVRGLVWQHDADTSPHSDEDADQMIGAREIERAFLLGKQDLFIGQRLLDDAEKLKEAGISALVLGMRHFGKSEASSSSMASDFQCSIEMLEMPLKAVLKKHLGDLCADADEWIVALDLYEAVEADLSDFYEADWNRLSIILRDATLQSKSTALRILREADEAARVLRAPLKDATIVTSPALLLNASHDEMVADILRAKRFDFAPDRRASILQTPQLIAVHDTSSALANWLDEKFTNASQHFWAALRRQIALGSAEEVRKTKAQYARCLFEELRKSPEHKRRPGLFWMGLRLLLESGQSDAAKILPWDANIVRSQLNEELLDNAIAYVSRYSGSRNERISVAIECFANWVKFLARDQSHLARKMLSYLCEISTEPRKSPWNSQNIGERSIELLTEVATIRPEFNREVANLVAGIVTRVLNGHQGWKPKSDAIKLAENYAPTFSDDELAQVIDGILAILAATDPAKDQWPITRSAIDLLMSEHTPRIAAASSERGARVIDAILRFGLNQSSEHARVLFYLQDFDLLSLRDESVVSKLHDVVQHVSTQSQSINSSNAIYNANALLYSSRISGSEGVRVGLEVLQKILRSCGSENPSISFYDSYQALNLLVGREEQITADTSITPDELRAKLNGLFEAVLYVWHTAKRQPLIFTAFSIPSAVAPHPAVVHNWAYASLSLGQALNRRSEIIEALSVAEAEPTLREPIILARATRLAGGDSEELTYDKISEETAPAFYASLGQRLLALPVDLHHRRSIVAAMLKKCLREGPEGLDAAVFFAAAEAKVESPTSNPDYQSYRVRLDNNRDLRLALFPMLNKLANASAASSG